MKRIILTVALFMFFSLFISGCQSTKSTSFEIRNGVTWSSSLSDVRKSENNNNVKYDDYADFYAMFPEEAYEKRESLIYDNVSVSNHNDACLSYRFRDGVLVDAEYSLSDMTEDSIENIYDSLKAKYGKCVGEDIQRCQKLMEAAGRDWTMFMNPKWYHNYSNWKLADGTFIVAWSDKSRANTYYISYLNGNELDKYVKKPNTNGL